MTPDDAAAPDPHTPADLPGAPPPAANLSAAPPPAAADLSADVWLAANPFPGLRPFQPGEGDRFFGRGQQIAELVQRLAEVPFIAVSGSSGCGKSSLVLAGVLNVLARQAEAAAEAAAKTAAGTVAGRQPTAAMAAAAAPATTVWRPVVLRPGSRPIAHLATPLAAALRPADGDPAEDAQRADALNGRLRLGGLGLVEAVRQARLPEGVRVLVVVDQFEEIFRFKRVVDPDEASAFVKLLLQAANDPASPVSVVITLRSDTLGACADFRDLAETVSRGGYLVPRLKREQRKEAIINPVLLRRAAIAPRLVQRLLNDVSDDFDDLPVMQHVLSRTWRHWATHGGPDTRPLDLADYEAVGGAAAALSNHADEACRSLGALGLEPRSPGGPSNLSGQAAKTEPPAGGLVARIFRALTERVGEGAEIRRPLAFDELCAVCAGPQATAAQVGEVVERYRRTDTAFLMPGAEVALADNPVIDISHESLIRQWKHLRGWVTAETEAKAELLRLVEDARRHTQEDGELWRGRSLERAREWEQLARPNAAWVGLCTGGDGVQQWADAMAFLGESRKAEQRDKRRERAQIWGLRALALGVLLVSVFAAFNGQGLQRQARSRELANRALLELGLDPARSAHLGLAAVTQDPDNVRAQYALRQAMAVLEVARTEDIVAFDAPVADARYSGDATQLVVAAGKEVVVLDAATLKRQATVTAPATVVKAWLVAGQVLTLTDDWRVQLQALDGKPVADLSCRGAGNSAHTAVASPAHGNRPAQLAVGCYDGELTLWHVGPSGALARHALVVGADDRTPTVTALGFSGDGQWLAAGDNSGSARVWKFGVTDRPWIGRAPPGVTPMGHDGAIRDIAFHPQEPTLLATASDDKSTRVWSLDLEAGKLVPDLVLDREQPTQHRLQHDRPVLRARFVQRVDDPYRLMTVSDKRVYFWSDETTRDERRHDDWVTEANVSADGEMLVSASSDGTARVWSSRSSAPIAVLRGHRNEVTHAFFAPAADGDRVVITTSTDRTLRRWRLNPPQLLVAEKVWMHSAVATPDGQQVLVCGERFTLGETKNVNCQQVALDASTAKPPSTGVGVVPPSSAYTGAAGAAARCEPLAAVQADAVQGLSVSNDGRWLLGQRSSQDVYRSVRPTLWRLADRADATPAWLDKWQLAVFNPGQPELLTMDETGTLALWPMAALGQPVAEPLLTLDAKTTRTTLALSPDGRWIAANDGARITLWDRRAPSQPPLSLDDHAGDVRSLAFSRDSALMVSASADRSARVWALAGLASGQRPASRELGGGHSAALWSANFSPDGRQVVTASADNTVRVWDTTTGQPLATLARHSDAVTSVSVHPDGQRILSASDDGTAVLGRCEACSAPLALLRERAAEVRLPDDERRRIDGETRVQLNLFMLPRWLGGSK